jgi:hypothetical protein
LITYGGQVISPHTGLFCWEELRFKGQGIPILLQGDLSDSELLRLRRFSLLTSVWLAPAFPIIAALQIFPGNRKNVRIREIGRIITLIFIG